MAAAPEPAMPSRNAAHGGGPTRDWASVPSDLSDIFTGGGETSHRLPGLRGRVVQPSRRGGVSVASVGVIVATGLIGIAVGAMLPAGAEAPSKAAPASLTMPLLPPQARPTATAAAMAAAPPAAPAQGDARDPPRKTREPTRPTTRTAAVTRPIGGGARTTPGSGARIGAAENEGGLCEGSRCGYAEVLTADRRLRRAYDDAVLAGVPRKDLVSVRNRWSRVRNRADDDPAYVVTSFSSMERDLNMMALNARRRAS